MYRNNEAIKNGKHDINNIDIKLFYYLYFQYTIKTQNFIHLQ